MGEKVEYLELLRQVNEQKDIIKKSSQNIIAINNRKKTGNIDHEIIEIMTALGKIGTMTGNANKFNDLAMYWKDALHSARGMKSSNLSKLLINDLLNDICLISFDIKKNGKKFEIKLPKIEFNMTKLGDV